MPNGPNIVFNVLVAGAKVTFTYDAASHVLTIVAMSPARPAAPAPSPTSTLRERIALGTGRNTRSKVWYTVANGVLSDVYYPTIDNTNLETLQYVVTDGSTFTDLQTRDMTYAVRGSQRRRHGLRGYGDGEERALPDRDRVHHRPEPALSTDARQVQAARSGLPALRPLRSDGERQRRRRRGNGGADSATVDDSTGHPVLVSSDPVTATNAVNRDYAQPVYARRWTARSARRRAASSAPPATGSSSSTPRTR